MNQTKLIWFNGAFIPWEDAKVHILPHALHYGTSVFEGVRCYNTERGPAIFRLREHMTRLIYSANSIKLTIPYSTEELSQAACDLIRKNEVKEAYIRPIAYYGSGKMGLNPRGATRDVSMICWPWGAYLPHDQVDLKVSKYIRIDPRSSIADAKIAGNYINSILASQEVEGTKYHEALFLDFQGNIAEGPGENFFIIKKNTLYTPSLGTILPGITRDSVIQIAKHLGYSIVEKQLKLDEAFEAEEAFFTGTAAEVVPIRSIDDRAIGTGTVGPITKQIKDYYLKTVHGDTPEFHRFLTWV